MSTSSRRIARNAGVLVVGDIAAKVASLAFYIAVARALGQSGFGDFNFALSLAVVLITISGFGLDTLLTREIARDTDEIHRMLWNTIGAKLAFGIVGVFAATGIALIGDYSSEVVLAVTILSVATLTELLGKSIGGVFQGVEDMTPVAIAGIVQRFTTAILAIAALLAGAGLLAVSGLYLFGAALGLLYSVFALRRRDLNPRVTLSRDHMKALVLASVPIGVGGIFNTILYRLDSTLLSFLDSNDAVGLYGAAYRLLDSTLFISFFFVAAMFPVLSRLNRETEPSSGEAFEVGAKVLVATLLPLGACFVLFADPLILALYGDDFEPAASAVQLLGGAAVLYGIAYLSTSFLVAQDRQRLLPWIVGGVAVQNVVLNFILIPSHSYNGAAVATTISEATLALVATIFVLRETGPLSTRRILIGPVIACAVMAGVTVAVGASLLSLALAVVVYSVVLVGAERWLYPRDLRLVTNAAIGEGAEGGVATRFLRAERSAPDTNRRRRFGRRRNRTRE